ncbi:MAG: hypothetical protein L0Y38_09865 [Methylococcaceae bacterium]|nr:hypothetical protein [Methylococcaceae bacterium]MCI0667041.1 hypothetical protein [Methylococcaceae bacterium]MCI0734110.1 hypothetical protein [Methylococcaceae bacterium]
MIGRNQTGAKSRGLHLHTSLALAANDPPSGHQLLWQGYTEFQFMCLGFALSAET